MTANDTPRASEGGHWYDPRTGLPVYEVPSADGKNQIKCTLRQARPRGLFPGVTSIIGCASAPALERWKREQTLLSALTLPRQDGESDAAYIARIIADSDRQAEEARDEGTAIHAAIEAAYQEREFDPSYAPHVMAAREALATAYPLIHDWRAEKVVVAKSFGYGTKIDLYSPSTGVVVDFKGKEFDRAKAAELSTYESHWMQLAAGSVAANGYSIPLPRDQHAICYVSRDNPGLATVCKVTNDQTVQGWECFKALLSYWQASRNYYPHRMLKEES